MNPPDLILLTAQTRADDSEGAAYCKDLALINLEAFLRYIAPFVPVHLEQEHERCIEDVEFALKLGSKAA
jgi:hypothetical protein